MHFNYSKHIFNFKQTDTVKVLWTFGETDPIYGDLKGHGKNRGYKSLNLLGPMFRKEVNTDTHKWDVTVQNVSKHTCSI